MKLLLDQNLPPRLTSKLSSHSPETIHVRDVGLQSADDQHVSDFAIEHGYVIVSIDSDFHQLAFLAGPPPKVIWIRLGNCSTSEIQALLQESVEQVRQFIVNRESAFLIME